MLATLFRLIGTQRRVRRSLRFRPEARADICRLAKKWHWWKNLASDPFLRESPVHRRVCVHIPCNVLCPDLFKSPGF